MVETTVPQIGWNNPRMAEILRKDGTWALDGDAVRVTPGRDRSVGPFRRELDELLLSPDALAGVSFEAGGRGGSGCGRATAPTRCSRPVLAEQAVLKRL